MTSPAEICSACGKPPDPSLKLVGFRHRNEDGIATGPKYIDGPIPAGLDDARGIIVEHKGKTRRLALKRPEDQFVVVCNACEAAQ